MIKLLFWGLEEHSETTWMDRLVHLEILLYQNFHPLTHVCVEVNDHVLLYGRKCDALWVHRSTVDQHMRPHTELTIGETDVTWEDLRHHQGYPFNQALLWCKGWMHLRTPWIPWRPDVISCAELSSNVLTDLGISADAFTPKQLWRTFR